MLVAAANLVIAVNEGIFFLPALTVLCVCEKEKVLPHRVVRTLVIVFIFDLGDFLFCMCVFFYPLSASCLGTNSRGRVFVCVLCSDDDR